MKLLVLGGTAEARQLALAAHALPGLETVLSLAGLTPLPADLPVSLHVGGFGGPEGLEAYLRGQHVDLVVDATHPFASRMSEHAARAARQAGIARLVLRRPGWTIQAGDRWLRVDSLEAAAAILPEVARRVFLTLGRQHLEPFAAIRGVWFLYRLVSPDESVPHPPPGLPIYGRGPFSEEAERQLLAENRIDALVTRNSGGTGTYAKIAAARAAAIRVVMIDRPQPPDGERVETVQDALRWIAARTA